MQPNQVSSATKATALKGNSVLIRGAKMTYSQRREGRFLTYSAPVRTEMCHFGRSTRTRIAMRLSSQPV